MENMRKTYVLNSKLLSGMANIIGMVSQTPCQWKNWQNTPCPAKLDPTIERAKPGGKFLGFLGFFGKFSALIMI